MIKEGLIFEGLPLQELYLMVYRGGKYDGLNVDLVLTMDVFDEMMVDYDIDEARGFGRVNDGYIASGHLSEIISFGWPDGLPEDIRQLLSRERVCVFSGHGCYPNSVDILSVSDWYGRSMPVEGLVDYFAGEYDTILFGVCNPRREKLTPRCDIIYALGKFGADPDRFEMVVKKYSKI